MALIACPECKGTVSDQAMICPNCGVGIVAKNRTEVRTRRMKSNLRLLCICLLLISEIGGAVVLIKEVPKFISFKRWDSGAVKELNEKKDLLDKKQPGWNSDFSAQKAEHDEWVESITSYELRSTNAHTANSFRAINEIPILKPTRSQSKLEIDDYMQLYEFREGARKTAAEGLRNIFFALLAMTIAPCVNLFLLKWIKKSQSA